MAIKTIWTTKGTFFFYLSLGDQWQSPPYVMSQCYAQWVMCSAKQGKSLDYKRGLCIVTYLHGTGENHHHVPHVAKLWQLGLQKGPLLPIFMRLVTITTTSCRKAMRDRWCRVQNKGITLNNNLYYKRGVCYLSSFESCGENRHCLTS